MTILYYFKLYSVIFYLFIFGAISNFRRNFIVILLILELMMLSLNWQFIVTSIILDDIYGKICSLMLLVISGGESAIGLALIVSYYKIRGSINLETGLKLIG